MAQFTEKLTEKINAITVTKSTKDKIRKIADIEQIHIQQVCRRLLNSASTEYLVNITSNNSVNQRNKAI